MKSCLTFQTQHDLILVCGFRVCTYLQVVKILLCIMPQNKYVNLQPLKSFNMSAETSQLKNRSNC